MATGSGKTLIIVKLVELLDYLMREGIIPIKDILFLTHRDDLILAFKKHVEEYNEGRERKIILEELKNFHERKANPTIFDRENILVFYYRADLLSDVSGEKRLDYKNYENSGNWYLILDEAHKGDQEESKRKQIYTVFARNGFLFNFSATFTDEFDIASTIYKFNLADFVREGYGKHIIVMETETSKFKQKNEDYSTDEKKKIVAKLLIFTAFLRKMRKYREVYPSPMAVVLVHTVNTEDADLKLFFEEVFNVAVRGLDESEFNRLKNEIISELKELNFWAEGEGAKLDEDEVSKLNDFSVEDFYSYFFNSSGPSELEILYHPENRQELLFKLKNADLPFALIRIGDVSNWLKSLSESVDLVETFEKEESFLKIDELENVSLLAGSRSFYEGWDSPRPNVIAYINIGGREAKKFILQSLGRGVRVKIDENGKTVRMRQGHSTLLETLFIFAVNRNKVLKVIDETLQEEAKSQWEVVGGITKTSLAEKKKEELLIPVYRKSEKKLIDIFSFKAGEEDYREAKAILANASDIVLSVWFGKDLDVIRTVREKFDKIKLINGRLFKNGEILLKKFCDSVEIYLNEVEKFEKANGKISHYRKIEVDLARFDVTKKKSLEKIIESKISLPNFEGLAIEAGEVIEKHFYIPVLRASDGTKPETLSWIRRIIKNESEVEFFKDMIKNHFVLDENFDWWMFSKIHETTDEVYIPYFEEGREKRWYPDFIFWLSKGEFYYIVFVDPKGTAFASNYVKIDYGVKGLFEDEVDSIRVFIKGRNGRKIIVRAFFYNRDLSNIPEKHKKYWITSIKDLVDKINSLKKEKQVIVQLPGLFSEVVEVS